MKVRGLLLFSFGLALAMALFAFILAGRLPPGAVLTTHWNAAGEPDGAMPARTALLVAPGMICLLSLLFAAIPRLEPLQTRLEGSARVARTAWIGTLAVLVLAELMIAAPVLGWHVSRALPVGAAGLLLIAIGNVLPKSRPGFFVGVRTPWAISDADNWVATNRFGGKALIVAGLLILAAALLPVPGAVRGGVVLVAALGAAMVPTGYSWWLWRRSGQDRP